MMSNARSAEKPVCWVLACALCVWATFARADDVLRNSDFSRPIVVIGDEDRRIDQFGEPGVWFLTDGGSSKGAWKHVDGVARRRQSEDEDSAGAMFQYVHDERATQGRRLLRFDVFWDGTGCEYPEEVDLALNVFGYGDQPPVIDSQNSSVDVDGADDTLDVRPGTVNLFSNVANDESPLVLIEDNVARVAGLRPGAGRQTVSVEIDFNEGYEYVGVLFDGEAREGARLEIDNVRFTAPRDASGNVEFWSQASRPDCGDALTTPEGPYVELTNGDVLPALVTGWQSPEPGDDTGHLSVELRGRLTTLRPNAVTDLSIRDDHVRRIVLGDSRSTSAEPGRIVFRDGRRVSVSRVVFTENGIRALGPDGTLSATFAALQEIHFPNINATAGVFRDVAWRHAVPEGRLVRLQMLDGARMTFPASLAQKIPSRRGAATVSPWYAVQPRWAARPLAFSLNEIYLAAARPADETPLSLMPCRAVDRSSGIHRWAWQRDRSVLGDVLQVGDTIAPTGFGTHAPAHLVVDLPPGARTFRCQVGIDRAVRDARGCAVCRITAPGRGQPLWTSPLIRAADCPVRVSPLDVSDIKQLELTAEMAHDGRPPDAAPFDIGDHVDWLRPTVTVDMQVVPPVPDGAWERRIHAIRRRAAVSNAP